MIAVSYQRAIGLLNTTLDTPLPSEDIIATLLVLEHIPQARSGHIPNTALLPSSIFLRRSNSTRRARLSGTNRHSRCRFSMRNTGARCKRQMRTPTATTRCRCKPRIPTALYNMQMCCMEDTQCEVSNMRVQIRPVQILRVAGSRYPGASLDEALRSFQNLRVSREWKQTGQMVPQYNATVQDISHTFTGWIPSDYPKDPRPPGSSISCRSANEILTGRCTRTTM